MDNEKLINHARHTVKELEGKCRHRGVTTGIKKWELNLLYSAYEALAIPKEERKFGLDKVDNPANIQKRYRP